MTNNTSNIIIKDGGNTLESGLILYQGQHTFKVGNLGYINILVNETAIHYSRFWRIEVSGNYHYYNNLGKICLIVDNDGYQVKIEQAWRFTETAWTFGEYNTYSYDADPLVGTESDD